MGQPVGELGVEQILIQFHLLQNDKLITIFHVEMFFHLFKGLSD
jgi:hypothetical protein